MNKLIALLALMVASSMAIAQAGGATPSTTPGQTQAEPGQAAPATGAQAAPAPTGKRQPQAKTQEEFAAFNEASQKPDPAAMEQSAADFVKKFPDSELKAALYQNLMLKYQNANNAEKVIETGRQTLKYDPDNAVALVTVASTLANRTRETDLDKDERLAEAQKDAKHAIELMDSGNGVPANMAPDQASSYKETIDAMAYGALGQAEFVNKNYAGAEQNLRKSTGYTNIQPDPIAWFQLALALDQQGKYADAEQAAEKCIAVANGHPVAQYCKQESAHAKQAAANPPAKAPAATSGPVPTTVTPK